MSVLTMDLNQQLTQFAPVVTEEHSCTVDETTGATIAADHATKQTFMPVFKLVFLQPAQSRWRIFQRKTGDRSARAAPVRDHVGFSAATETKTEGIYCNIDLPAPGPRQFIRSCRYENQSQAHER